MKVGLAVTVAPHHLTLSTRLGLYDADPAAVKAALKAARKDPER
jgi:hypothetical protein